MDSLQQAVVAVALMETQADQVALVLLLSDTQHKEKANDRIKRENIAVIQLRGSYVGTHHR
jgi:hypothetical protein